MARLNTFKSIILVLSLLFSLVTSILYLWKAVELNNDTLSSIALSLGVDFFGFFIFFTLGINALFIVYLTLNPIDKYLNLLNIILIVFSAIILSQLNLICFLVFFGCILLGVIYSLYYDIKHMHYTDFSLNMSLLPEDGNRRGEENVSSQLPTASSSSNNQEFNSGS